jgi:hypothetical protein
MSRETYYPGVIGMEIKPDTSRIGHIDDGNLAFDERIVEARRQWPEARAEDFEKVGRRRWRDRATQIEYKEARGAPLLSGVGTDAVRNIVSFFVLDGHITFLERIDVPVGTVIHHGEFYGAEVVDGRIRRSA